MGEFRSLYRLFFTLYFPPKASGEIKCICIVGNGELSSVTSGSSEEADLIICVKGDAVSEARERRVAKNFQFLERHCI